MDAFTGDALGMVRRQTGPPTFKRALARTAGQIAENEAFFKAAMLLRENPGEWREVFALRESGISWEATLTILTRQRSV